MKKQMNGLKEFFTYITNQLKFWFIVKEWENGLQLRNGRIIRMLKEGLYVKIPFLDFVYCQPKRVQDIVCGFVAVREFEKQLIGNKLKT